MVNVNYKIKICQTCGNQYTPLSGIQKYCPVCRARTYTDYRLNYARKKRTHPCKLCGKYCWGQICRQCIVENASYRYKDVGGGYIILYMPNHHLANHKGMVYEHRLIAEEQLGRWLAPSEIVHHLNGVRDDNRPQNLVVVKCHSHPGKTFIKALQNRIWKLEAQLAQHKLC